MSRDRVILDSDNEYSYRLVWFLDDEDDIGGTIGDGGKVTQPQFEAAITEGNVDAAEGLAAALAAEAEAPTGKDWRGFFWESRRAAQKACASVNRAVRAARAQATAKVPLPEWAQKALAAGWKPPTGWKP